MREPIIRTIDNEMYTFYQLPPKQSLKILTRIMKIVGPALGVFLDGNDILKLEMLDSIQDVDFDFGEALVMLFDRMNESEIDYITNALLSQVFVDGKGEVSKVFDDHFGGRLPHMFKVLATALEVEYGDFLAGKLEEIKAKLRARRTIQAKPISNG